MLPEQSFYIELACSCYHIGLVAFRTASSVFATRCAALLSTCVQLSSPLKLVVVAMLMVAFYAAVKGVNSGYSNSKDSCHRSGLSDLLFDSALLMHPMNEG